MTISFCIMGSVHCTQVQSIILLLHLCITCMPITLVYPDIKITTCMYMALSLCCLMRALAFGEWVHRKRCTHSPLANNNMYAPSKPYQHITPNYAIINTDPFHTLFNRTHEKHISLPVNKEWNSQPLFTTQCTHQQIQTVIFANARDMRGYM